MRFDLRGMLLGAAASVLGVSGSGPAGAADQPSVVVSYWQQATALPETVLATQPDLQKTIPATVSYRPITSGPAALAAMKAGAYDFVGGVGNPPVLAAIANHTKLKVIWAQYYDSAGLAVRSDLKVPDDLMGKTFAEQVGSSEAFSFYGWLKNRDLIGKVKVIDMLPAAMLAAFKSGSIAGGYVSEPFPSLMVQAKGKMVVTSAQMTDEGWPAVNVIAANADLVKSHPEVVQAYVCALQKATDMIKGPDSTPVLNKAGAFSGGTPDTDEVVKMGREWPYWPLAEQVGPKGLGTVADPASGVVAKVLYNTGLWMKEQGKIADAPDQKTVADAIDPSFAQYVVDGKCK